MPTDLLLLLPLCLIHTGLCTDNCGNGQGTNCETVCDQYVVTYESPKQCSAAQAGGGLCPGTKVCCRCPKL
jgi:hypothetical protein